MARRNSEKTIKGTFIPAIRETFKGVARTEEEINKLKEAGKVENVLWVGTNANAYKALAQSIRPALEVFAKGVIKATGEKNRFATVDRFVAHMLESARMIEWQLPAKEPVVKRSEDGTIEF